jgi:hypothetical protein
MKINTTAKIYICHYEVYVTTALITFIGNGLCSVGSGVKGLIPQEGSSNFLYFSIFLFLIILFFYTNHQITLM